MQGITFVWMIKLEQQQKQKLPHNMSYFKKRKRISIINLDFFPHMISDSIRMTEAITTINHKIFTKHDITKHGME